MTIKVTAEELSSPNPQVGTTGETENTLAEVKNYLILNSLLVQALITDVKALAEKVNTLP